MNHAKACLIMGALTLFIVGSDIFMASPLLPFIAEDFKISVGYTGWMVTLYAIAYAIGCTIVGYISDRIGRKKLIIIGLTGLLVANVLASVATSFIVLIIARMLAGLFLSAIAPSVYAIIGDVAPQNKKGSWLSIVVAGHLTGLAIGTPLGSFLQFFVGWRFIFGAIAVISFLLALGNYLLLPKQTGKKSREAGISNTKAIFSSVSITAIWSTSMYGLYTYLGAGLYLVHGYSSLEIGRVLIIYGIGAMSGSLLAGKFADRFGAKSISTKILFTLSGVLIFIGLFSSFEYVLLVGIFFWAIVGYGYIPSYQSRLVGEYPQETGKVMAWNITAMYVGMTLGSLLGGIIITLFNFYLLPIICACIAFLAGSLSSKVKSNYKKNNPIPNVNLKKL